MEISIIIVNYNSSNLLAECLESILTNITKEFEVIVTDNASSDNSIQTAKISTNFDKRIKYVLSPDNEGFARANNKAVTIASGKYIHFLNPDTQVSNDLDIAYSEILKSNGDLYVTQLSDSNGQIVKSRNLIYTPQNIFKSIIRKANYWYTGASIIIKREVFYKINGWTSEYFMYSEDMDLFYKTSRISIYPIQLQAVIKHIGQGCTTKIWSNLEREVKVQTSFKLFFKLHRNLFEYYETIFIFMFRYLFLRPSFLPFYIKVLYLVNIKN